MLDYCYSCYDYCLDYLCDIDWVTVIVFIVTLIAFYFAYILEYKDLFCPNDNQKCKLGNGAAYEEGKVSNLCWRI